MISLEGHEECCLLGDFISGKGISWRCMIVAIATSGAFDVFYIYILV